MKIKLNHILAAIVVVLLALCWASVRRPMHFADQRKQREAEVIQRLTEIRKAEKATDSASEYTPGLSDSSSGADCLPIRCATCHIQKDRSLSSQPRCIQASREPQCQ